MKGAKTRWFQETGRGNAQDTAHRMHTTQTAFAVSLPHVLTAMRWKKGLARGTRFSDAGSATQNNATATADGPHVTPNLTRDQAESREKPLPRQTANASALPFPFEPDPR